MKSPSLKQRYEPYLDVIIFMLTLFVVNYFWKFTVQGDEYGEQVTWFGMDVTAPFEWMACHVASVVYRLVALCRDTVFMPDAHTIRFDNGIGTTIVWGCSGFKQMFIWFFLILTVRNDRKPSKSAGHSFENPHSSTIIRNDSNSLPYGEGRGEVKPLWLHKLWFIPFGWLCCYAFNILRIFLITILIENHPTWFHPLHDYLFKYMFYAMMFLLWVWFVEKIRPSQGTDSSLNEKV